MTTFEAIELIWDSAWCISAGILAVSALVLVVGTVLSATVSA